VGSRVGSTAGSQKGSGSGEEWRNQPGEGPRERVVFGDEESGSKEAAAKKSQKGSGDDKEERTDQIDVSKFKGDVDPFADKKPERTPEELAAREKFIKALVGLGVIGILMTGGLLYYINAQSKVAKPPIDIFFPTPCAVNEVKRY